VSGGPKGCVSVGSEGDLYERVEVNNIRYGLEPAYRDICSLLSPLDQRFN
jgi:hypothetical protein